MGPSLRRRTLFRYHTSKTGKRMIGKATAKATTVCQDIISSTELIEHRNASRRPEPAAFSVPIL